VKILFSLVITFVIGRVAHAPGVLVLASRGNELPAAFLGENLHEFAMTRTPLPAHETRARPKR
jgi:hypothetical protein